MDIEQDWLRCIKNVQAMVGILMKWGCELDITEDFRTLYNIGCVIVEAQFACIIRNVKQMLTVFVCASSTILSNIANIEKFAICDIVLINGFVSAMVLNAYIFKDIMLL